MKESDYYLKTSLYACEKCHDGISVIPIVIFLRPYKKAERRTG